MIVRHSCVSLEWKGGPIKYENVQYVGGRIVTMKILYVQYSAWAGPLSLKPAGTHRPHSGASARLTNYHSRTLIQSLVTRKIESPPSRRVCRVRCTFPHYNTKKGLCISTQPKFAFSDFFLPTYNLAHPALFLFPSTTKPNAPS